MKVGVYIDGFNLYYGGRGACGRGTAGWRWLDLRALATTLCGWPGSTIERVVYCTAEIDSAENPSGYRDQQVYLKALTSHHSVDLIEKGNYVRRVKRAPLATPDARGRPVLVESNWPVMVKSAAMVDVPRAHFMVSYAYREEKGSDVNVASHLLVDVLTGAMDGAIVISNDSDLRFPIEEARRRVPVGTVNPSPTQLAGALRASASVGVGHHWWRQLTPGDYRNHQMPDPAGRFAKPLGW